MRRLLALLALVLAAPAMAQQQPDPLAEVAKVVLDQDRCEGLAGGRFKGLKGAATWVTRANYVAATDKRQAHCSVFGYVNPTNNFGLYLPIDRWNGRYLVRGCGGSCGAALVELACALHVRDGYACLITDMGHSSTNVDNNWVDNNLQGLVDFGYRSTHVTTLAGKAIATAFYATPPNKSYFLGCSTGGRQGLIEAQRFPEDFDGIVAIAPASIAPYGSRQAATITDVDAFNTRPDGAPILPNRKAILVHAAVVRACDKTDGIADGLIGDPWRCTWEPQRLACKGSETRDCLSPAQVAVVRKLYERRGAQKGSELNWIGNFIRNAPLPGEAWKPLLDLGFGRGDPATIESMVNPNNPDLRPFQANRGKLILVHGLSDQSVMPPPTLDYYETATRTMGGSTALRAFARMYLIPGMDHCAGGEGASAIDYLTAITHWVEQGKAPDALRGVHVRPGAPLDFFGIDLPNLDRKWYAFERDHQAWPGRSVMVGKDRPRAQDDRPLAVRLSETMEQAEKTSAAAGFPRQSTLNAVVKAMWELFYRSGADSAAQTAALQDVPAPSTSIRREALARMLGEVSLD